MQTETRPTTLRELRDSGHRHRPVKAEIRENLLDLLRSGRPRFPGIVGFDETVLPALERALLAGHDLVLLGERGQGKTRLIRTLVRLLDEWTPVVDGCEINDHPYAPVCARCRRLHAELGDDLPVGLAAPQRAVRREARHPRHQRRRPDRRHRPDQGRRGPHARRPGDRALRPGAAHQPRHLRHQRAARPGRADPGVAAQRARGARHPGPRLPLRLPLDLLLVASANPEDYTNRGRIITPLKDRFGAEVRTHYPDLLAGRDRRRSARRPTGRRDGAGLPARGRRPLHPRTCASRRRSTSAPACRRGSASRLPRPRPPRRCAGPR